MPAYKVLNPLTIVFFSFVFVCLFLQNQHTLERSEQTIWIILWDLQQLENQSINLQERGRNGNSLEFDFRRPHLRTVE